MVGAGIAGLTTAAACAMKGARVLLTEQAGDITEVGAGLQISPNGWAVIEALGLDQRIYDEGLRADAVELLDGRDGRQVLKLDFQHAAPDRRWIFIHRGRLIAALEDAARAAGVRIGLGTRLETPKLPGRNGPVLVGADGIRSTVRRTAFGAAEARFAGQVAWRATIPDRSFRNIAQVYMGPRRHLVSYPLRGGLRNIVGVEERDDWVHEDWRQTDDPEHFRRAFASFAPQVARWLEQVEEVHLWGLFLHPVAKSWHSGGTVLVGDAAHPTLPFLAQGANLALEDGWAIARCLEEYETLPMALDAFERHRQPRATRAVEASFSNARAYHLENPALRYMAHSALRVGAKIAPGVPLRRFDWLYGYDVRKEHL